MKKIFLFAATMLLSMSLMAKTDYPLRIIHNGVTIDVNSDNEDDILGDGFGTVMYDADQQALTLSNATINGNIWYHPSWDPANKLEVRVLGKCVIAMDETNIKSSILFADYTAHLEINGYGTEPAELEIRNMKGSSTGAAIKLDKYDGTSELSTSQVSLKVTCENGPAIVCDELKVSSLTYIDARSADAERAISCADDKFMLTETKIAYSTKNHATKADGNHIIIVPDAALEEYGDVRVQGRMINNYTINDVFEDESGSTWNRTKKVLTIKGSDYTNKEVFPFLAFSTPATLELVGPTKYINGSLTGTPVISTIADLTITGSAKSEFNNSDASIIEVNPADATTLKFLNANVTMYGKDYSIQNNKPGTNVTLAFESSRLVMYNVKDITNASFKNCEITNPGGPFALDDGSFIDQNKCMPDCEKLTDIEIEATNPYPVKVDYRDVYPYNAADILEDGGLVSYNHATKTLTVLEGAALSGGGYDPLISVDGQDLTVIFKGLPTYSGDDMVFADDHEAIKMANGTGHKLTLISEMGSEYKPIIFTSDNISNLSVISAEGAEVEFRGALPFKVRAGWNFSDAALFKAKKLIVNAPLSFINEDATTAYDAIDEAVAIELSENMELDPAMTTIQLNPGTKKVEWVSPSTDPIRDVRFTGKALDDKFTLKVGGIDVTKANKDDIFGNGTVRFDEATATLKLNNATIEASETFGIYTIESPNITKLTIEVRGTNIIRVEKSYGIGATISDLDIVGIGANPYLALEVEANSGTYTSIFSYGNVTIKDVALAVTVNNGDASSHALSIYNKLTVDNADLRAAVVGGTATDAIVCKDFAALNGSDFLEDGETWKLAEWSKVSKKFNGTDLTHIWIGKSSEFPTDIESTFAPVEKATKIMMNGQIFILRGEHMYNMQGMMVR